MLADKGVGGAAGVPGGPCGRPFTPTGATPFGAGREYTGERGGPFVLVPLGCGLRPLPGTNV